MPQWILLTYFVALIIAIFQISLKSLNPFLYFPLLAIFWFLVGRFNNERALVEKYAFKATVTESLHHNIKILLNDYGDKPEFEKKIFTLIHSSLEMAYEKPYMKENWQWFINFFGEFQNNKAGLGIKGNNEEYRKSDNLALIENS